MQLGNLYFDAERYDDAIKWYGEALKLVPNDVNVSTDLGVCYYYTNQPDKALAQFDRSLKLDPKHAKTLLNVGIVRAFGKQDLDGATQAWQQVVEVAPDSPEGQAAKRALDSLTSAHAGGAQETGCLMLLRLALFIVLVVIVARAFWRLVDGIVEGVSGRPKGGRSQVPTRGVQMVRDPVCGTFVLPDRAVTIVDGRAPGLLLLRRLPRQVPRRQARATDRSRRRTRMTAESALRADIVEVGRRMYARGYTASNDGNISVRLGGDRLLMTPKSVCKGFMTPDMMCITDLEGSKLQGDRDPSSEMLMHLEVYRQRPDVQAVVHAHPPTATGFAVAGIPLDRAVLAEVLTTLGSIPIAEYATPSTSELPEAVRKYIKAHDGMLLANHGALTVGADLFGAYYKMETIEHFAKISLVARLLGRENLISREEVTRLQELRGDVRHQGAGADLRRPTRRGRRRATGRARWSGAGRRRTRLVPDAASRRAADGERRTGKFG